jgi:hypothetical protein
MKYLSCRILHENKIQYCFVWQCFGRHDLWSREHAASKLK